MNVEVFWGRTISQDQPLTFKTDTGTLIINQAALSGPSEGITTLSVESNYLPYDGEDEHGDHDVPVDCKTETLAVCHLTWGRKEFTPLKLFFGPLETVVFSVKGKGVIHITGKYRTEDEDDEDMSFDDDEDEYLNMSDEESDLESSTNNREVEMEDMSSSDEEEELKKPAALPPSKNGRDANGHKKNDKMRTSNDNAQYQNTKKPKKFEHNKNQSDNQRRNDNKNKKFHGGKPNKFNKH